MEVVFHSAPGLSSTLQRLGFDLDVAQLSQGTLHGVFRLGGGHSSCRFSQYRPIKNYWFTETDVLGFYPSA